MIEVFPGLHVGRHTDFVELLTAPGGMEGWAIVHAAKEPYHRDFVGYRERGAPKDSPEYLFAERGWRLALNLVDVMYPEYVHPKLIDRATAFVTEAFAKGKKVLIHCNQGGSRGPGLALHWLRRNDPRFADKEGVPLDVDIGEALMRGLYPHYNPAPGIRGFVMQHWDDKGETS